MPVEIPAFTATVPAFPIEIDDLSSFRRGLVVKYRSLSPRLVPLTWTWPVREQISCGDEASTFTSRIEQEDTSKLIPLIEQPWCIRPALGARERTLISWLENMDKLNDLIKRLQKLALSAPPEHRAQLLNKVATLRATFKRQQKRFIQFLKLKEEYADKYIQGISTKIQQQSTALDNLKDRSEAANKLHGDAVDLQTYYESGTVAAMKDLRAPTGKTVPCRLQRQNTETFDFQDFQGHFLRTMRYSARRTP